MWYIKDSPIYAVDEVMMMAFWRRCRRREVTRDRSWRYAERDGEKVEERGGEKQTKLGRRRYLEQLVRERIFCSALLDLWRASSRNALGRDWDQRGYRAPRPCLGTAPLPPKRFSEDVLENNIDFLITPPAQLMAFHLVDLDGAYSDII